MTSCSPRGRLGRVIPAASLAAATAFAHADEIYKTVDAHGVVVYSDHADPARPDASIVRLEDPRSPPRVMHFCWTNCFTLVYDDGAYRRTDGTEETWTVETFTDRSVVLHRHDAPAAWNGFSADVTYSGRAVDGRLADVTLNGRPAGGIDASWGNALDTLPADNVERDARKAAGSPPPDALPGSYPVDSRVSAAVAPPPLPEDPQPVVVEDGYLWIPGYWSYRDHGYLWVAGSWVRPPRVGLLWTPAWWEFAGSVYVLHSGYWGRTVGFYGGVNYGHGYFGNGYTGGRWEGGTFLYDRSVNRLSPTVVGHSYEAPLAAGVMAARVSDHGGSGRTTAVTSPATVARAAPHAHAANHPVASVVTPAAPPPPASRDAAASAKPAVAKPAPHARAATGRAPAPKH